jgi:hypothetical protein
MLSLPILNGRIGKWILALSEFDLRYESAKAIKGQVMADFVTHHCGPNVSVVGPAPWNLFFDGLSCGKGLWHWCHSYIALGGKFCVLIAN